MLGMIFTIDHTAMMYTTIDTMMIDLMTTTIVTHTQAVSMSESMLVVDMYHTVSLHTDVVLGLPR